MAIETSDEVIEVIKSESVADAEDDDIYIMCCALAFLIDFSSRTSVCNLFSVLLINTDRDKKASGSSMERNFFTDNFRTRFLSSFHLYFGVDNMVILGGNLREAPKWDLVIFIYWVIIR